jgi:hypothetical protein
LYSYDPENEIFSKTGIEVIDETRKSKLPIDMASMNKIKSIDKMDKTKSINANTENALQKFDGLSLCNDEVNTGTWTRGDGLWKKSDEHYKLIQKYTDIYENGDPFAIDFTYTYGYAKKCIFRKYSIDAGTGDFQNQET